MVVDYAFIQAKQAERLNKIKTLANAQSKSETWAEIYVDANAPITTNKRQLKQAGWQDDEVTEDNFRDVIEALALFNVEIRCDNNWPRETLIKNLNDVINEEVTECWGGPNVREIVEIGFYIPFQGN